ncbi:CD209 antigen isoform X3 [Phascolarctos cinereus]|uniref:CD209 antigen-like protein B isoform X2 n=1 Tax=Phascolarctos cinereus TaxID=38626 RepID=A0A6P5JS17_PHACI|nr:CD209 antigen-like protein B isoform X2 [Phascolarctos cinereus]
MCDTENPKFPELAGLDEDVLMPSGWSHFNLGSQRSQSLRSFPVFQNQSQRNLEHEAIQKKLNQLSAQLKDGGVFQNQSQHNLEHEAIQKKLNQLSAQLKDDVVFQNQSHHNLEHEAILKKLNQLSAQLKDGGVFQNQSQHNLEHEAILKKLNQLSAQLKDGGVFQNQSQHNLEHEAIQKKLNQLSAQLKDDVDLRTKEQVQASQLIQQLNKTLSTLCSPCPCDWKLYKDSCYHFSVYRKPWEAARGACEADDSNLVIISSSEEQKYLNQRADSNHRWWVGLSDKKKEGLWHWVDGTTLKQAFWNAGEPNNAGDEDCCELTSQGWNDAPCSKENFWICEKKASSCIKL